MVTSFSGGGSRSTRRELPTLGKQLVNFITCGCGTSAPFFVIYKAGHELRGKRFTAYTEITIILGTVRFTIRGGHLQYKRYDAHFLKKSSVELPFSSFGDHLINILRKVNRLIYAFKIN
jgi:hypothetical protein